MLDRLFVVLRSVRFLAHKTALAFPLVLLVAAAESYAATPFSNPFLADSFSLTTPLATFHDDFDDGSYSGQLICGTAVEAPGFPFLQILGTSTTALCDGFAAFPTSAPGTSFDAGGTLEATFQWVDPAESEGYAIQVSNALGSDFVTFGVGRAAGALGIGIHDESGLYGGIELAVPPTSTISFKIDLAVDPGTGNLLPTARYSIDGVPVGGVPAIPSRGQLAGGQLLGGTIVAGFVEECRDGQDNDGDGLADSEDPGCVALTDLSERDPTLPCDDGADNDGDQLIDFIPDGNGDGISDGDPGCKDPSSAREDPQCQDGINNDGGQDSLIDFDGGLSALGAAVTAPDPQCTAPWKGERKAPSCGLGLELGVVLLPLLVRTRRRRAKQTPS